MYIPKFNRIEDTQVLLEFMQQNSFATLVSVHEGKPFATPMPFTVESEHRLSAHLARANPQWQSLEGQEVLVIFQGHHSFISPTWYEKQPSVPTWNYLTVHAYGHVQIIHDPETVKPMLHKLVLQYEQQWKMEDLEDKYLEGMMKGIVAFEVQVSELQGKFKLSQNRSPADRAGVITGLGQSPNQDDRAIAKAMQALGETP